jgi:transposase
VAEVRSILLAMAEPDGEKRTFRLRWCSVYRDGRTNKPWPNAAKRRGERPNAPSAERKRPEATPPAGGGRKMTSVASEGASLTDEEWKMVKPLIPQKPPRGRAYNDHRTVLGGLLWVTRTGSSSWREMPDMEEFGKWTTAYYRRYELWVKQGLWQRILKALGEEGLPGPKTKEG